MPHSHHSHSGQFCPSHAVDNMPDIINHAISLNMTVFALTEHMPRHEIDRYPKETQTFEHQLENEANYVKEALRLREQFKGKIELPLGFEAEWIRPESEDLIKQSLERHPYDFFIGSVHHVHTVPIDYDQTMYQNARNKAGGTDERLFEDYFDAQYAMLKAIRPPVVGHFDLIRLKADDPDRSFKPMKGVWERILRNLDIITEYGGILEINSAAVRKGMNEPYPMGEICQAALERNIRFCLSDDSHGIDQVAACFDRVLDFTQKLGLETLTFLKHRDQSANPEAGGTADHRFPTLEYGQIDVKNLKELAFWRSRKAAKSEQHG